MMGLTLAGDLEDLALQYLAAIQAIAYGVKHIVDTLESSGHEFKVWNRKLVILTPRVSGSGNFLSLPLTLIFFYRFRFCFH